MDREEKLEQLRTLEETAARLRGELGVNEKGVIWRAETLAGLIVVEADGFGKGILLEVEGNYPVDFTTTFEQEYETEAAACEHAERLRRGDNRDDLVLERGNGDH